MFENFVSKILVRVLGDYIDDIDVETLSLSIFRGDVELQDLKFKKTAFDYFDLPVAIIDGHVGKIRVEIPWLALGTEPIRLTLSNIFLVVQPKKCVAYDKSIEEKRAFDVKIKKLDNHDRLTTVKKSPSEKQEEQEEKDAKQPLESDLAGQPSFVTRLIEKITNNLQFRLENVHIRYEDDSDHEKTIVTGLTLDGLHVQSCDDDWNVVFQNQYGDDFNKLLTVNRLSVYMNPDEDSLFSEVRDHDEFCERMRDLISRKRDENSYVIPEVNVAFKVKLQRAGKLDLLNPKVLADLFLDKIKIRLTESQWKNLLVTVEYVTNYDKYEKYRPYKPQCGLKNVENRDEWWKYAIRSVKHDYLDKTFTWKQINDLKVMREDYISLYKRSKMLPWLLALDSYEAERLKQLEHELDYDQLAFFRDIANEQVELEKQQHLFEESKKQGWTDWAYSWFGSSHSTSESSSHDREEQERKKKQKEEEDKKGFELDNKQKEHLYETIGYDATEELERTGAPPADYLDRKSVV